MQSLRLSCRGMCFLMVGKYAEGTLQSNHQSNAIQSMSHNASLVTDGLSMMDSIMQQLKKTSLQPFESDRLFPMQRRLSECCTSDRAESQRPNERSPRPSRSILSVHHSIGAPHSIERLVH